VKEQELSGGKQEKSIKQGLGTSNATSNPRIQHQHTDSVRKNFLTENKHF
jgi:hypothetical protein